MTSPFGNAVQLVADGLRIVSSASSKCIRVIPETKAGSITNLTAQMFPATLRGRTTIGAATAPSLPPD